MDIDFDDLDGPSKAPATKLGKFAPKNSKFKPVAKPKPKREPEPVAPSSESNPPAVPKMELDDSKPPEVASVNYKPEIEQPSHTVPSSHDGNGSVKMDIDTTEMEVDNDQEQDDGDQVVREIDVFFKSSVDANSKLYVLQYPLRQCWRPYELEDRCEKVRLKPETAEVKVEMSVQVDSINYDADVDDNKAMKKQVLATAWPPPKSAGHAVGILVGNQLHLNPVHAVVQLRPSMEHLQVRNPSKKVNGTHDEDIKNEKDLKQPKKQIKTGAVNEQIEDTKEQWIPLKYHSETSELSRGYLQNMVAEQDSQLQFSMSQSDYIDSLCPATRDKHKPKGPSVSSLLKLPLEERYMTQLLEGPPLHRFNVLKHIAPNDSDEDIFRVLQTHAQLVQGLWVAKSKLKYGKEGGREVLLRDYVLLQFSKNPIFHENQLPKSTALSEIMKGILDEFSARRESCRDWKFKEPPDDAFIKQHPNIVQEQKKIWDHAAPKIIDVLFPKSSKHSVSSNIAPRTKDPPPPPSNKTPMLDETREALPKALQKVFQTHKVCSLNKIRQRLHDMALYENQHQKGSREARAAAAVADASHEELMKTLNQVAVNIHGSFVSKSSLDHPQYDELRNIVINLFLAEGPKGKLKKASIYAAANMQLKREITNVEYQKVLSELCISQNSAWVLKSGDSPS